MEFIIWAFVVFGLTNILSISKIFAPLRYKLVTNKRAVPKKMGQLLYCTMCTGFWVGMLLSLGMPIMALYSSASCYLLYLVTEILINYAYPDKGSNDQ